ncbi:Protein PAL OF QUIRKY [Cardamine amara subsp. amara]|uniref:Protein PAL OF QUIRKY n=1 Tax=Cardamine amara subsp. amara TaxID=228776 RepID=A0ABD1AA70_CARAN
MSIGERSPKNKVKFMCSFGGKILPRPSDGVLKYVGGETRIVAISPDISFSELMKKLTAITENDNVLKYQIIPEDLDALVSVKSDEDVKYMIEEYNRHETPKLRTFLFPANPMVLENQFGSIESQTIEQRYIEAINGILRTPKSANLLRAPIKTRPSFTMSTSSSPNSESSPDGYTHEPPEQNNSYQLSRLYPMHKVHSSPNISQPYNHHHNAYLQPPNYLNARQRPPAPLDFPRGTGWDPHNSGGSNGRCGCNEERRFWGRASSVPQSPRKHGLRF